MSQLNAEEIINQYQLAMQSVNLINGPKPEDMSDEDWAYVVAEHKEFLLTMLAQDFWTTEDLMPIESASK